MNRRAHAASDEGSALVEFLGVTVLVMIPLVYLIITLAHLQAGMYATEAAARTAARAAATSGVDALIDGDGRDRAWREASAHAEASVALVAEDFGVGALDLTLACEGECLSPGSAIVADVTGEIGLPGVPAGVLDVAPLTVTLTARGASPIDGTAP
ncbi:pilus assembly protein [Demequina sp. NBRC 110051]|uniref:pilus assembly protein n=1 Tax=Demequina sp. NBRC 110051 TaxID=1570340 RepID=UPI0013565539|nr:pilus assembly protein [Demequina sp. NBRC 110051]